MTENTENMVREKSQKLKKIIQVSSLQYEDEEKKK